MTEVLQPVPSTQQTLPVCSREQSSLSHVAFREHHIAPSNGRPSRFGGCEWHLLAATWVVLLLATSTTVPQFKPHRLSSGPLPSCWLSSQRHLLPTALPPLPAHTPQLSTLPTAAFPNQRSDCISHLSPALHSFPCPTQSRSQSPYGNPQGPARAPALCHLASWLSLKHNTHTHLLAQPRTRSPSCLWFSPWSPSGSAEKTLPPRVFPDPIGS